MHAISSSPSVYPKDVLVSAIFLVFGLSCTLAIGESVGRRNEDNAISSSSMCIGRIGKWLGGMDKWHGEGAVGSSLGDGKE
jgi:hypothetical protein